MFILSRRIMRNEIGWHSAHTASYEEALKALSTLQSNAAYLQAVAKHASQTDVQKRLDTEKYLLRSGVTLEDLDKLSVIHVAGTKGKGSVCAFTESILRKHGYCTGFFSSPHLVSVRERIRINGEPLTQTQFLRYFWRVFNKLKDESEYETDMPTYFKFMTILMFNVFLESNIDVAIIEVGIGGENDCTNIVRNPVCVGITSLGLEHTALLGNTIEEIAFQKSGIFKPRTVAFTVPQIPAALNVLEKRAIEKNCTLHMVPRFDEYRWKNISPVRNLENNVKQQNASLAIQLTVQWICAKSGVINYSLISTCSKSERILRDNIENEENRLPSKYQMANNISIDKIAMGLVECKWPGRMQILRTSIADFFLDGAHTVESMECCISWFQSVAGKSKRRKILIFNITGDRNPTRLLHPLQMLNFETAYFVPNYSGVDTIDASTNSAHVLEQVERCKKNAEMWGDGSIVSDSVQNVIKDIKKSLDLKRYSNNQTKEKAQVLVTGSLHLVGAVLTILDPNLTMSTKL